VKLPRLFSACITIAVVFCAAGTATAQQAEALRAIPFCATGGQSSGEIMKKVEGSGWGPVAPDEMAFAAMIMADATYYRAADPNTDGDLFAKRRAHAETMFQYAQNSDLVAGRDSAILVLNRTTLDHENVVTRCDLFYPATDMSTGIYEDWGGQDRGNGLLVADFVEKDLTGNRNSIYDNVYQMTRFTMPVGTKPPQTATDYMFIETSERLR
jgi:hypothetical protein